MVLEDDEPKLGQALLRKEKEKGQREKKKDGGGVRMKKVRNEETKEERKDYYLNFFIGLNKIQHIQSHAYASWFWK